MLPVALASTGSSMCWDNIGRSMYNASSTACISKCCELELTVCWTTFQRQQRTQRLVSWHTLSIHFALLHRHCTVRRHRTGQLLPPCRTVSLSIVLQKFIVKLGMFDNVFCLLRVVTVALCYLFSPAWLFCHIYIHCRTK
jgi:hypothetical protein